MQPLFVFGSTLKKEVSAQTAKFRSFLWRAIATDSNQQTFSLLQESRLWLTKQAFRALPLIASRDQYPAIYLAIMLASFELWPRQPGYLLWLAFV